MIMITIRKMNVEDIDALYDAFLKQGWHPNKETYMKYFNQQEKGERQVFVAEINDIPVGYITLVPKAKSGPFVDVGYPELKDFNVLEAYQKQGIGTKLLDEAEHVAKQYSDFISLAVGLHAGYGSAQRLYIKRGYIPDGSGVWYQDKVLTPYTSCMNDDDLILYMCKRL